MGKGCKVLLELYINKNIIINKIIEKALFSINKNFSILKSLILFSVKYKGIKKSKIRKNNWTLFKRLNIKNTKKNIRLKYL